MTSASAAAAFVAKWANVTVNERATAQEHFIDLCHLFQHPTPIQADPKGEWYRFEKALTKTGGKAGFADVWKRGAFAWEYKTKGLYHDLSGAYQQLLLYKEALENPPILAACDIARYEIHVAFTGYKTRIETFTNQDLLTVSTRELLHLVFTDPAQLRPAEKITTVTEKIAEDFAKVAQLLEKRGFLPQRIAHFFMKLLFGMFAEDIGLLPNHLLSNSIKAAIKAPAEFPGRTQALFRTMREGGYFGMDKIPHFNGGLFDDDDVIALDNYELLFLREAADRDWRDVEPAIFGTLFERSLDPKKRAKLGAHYTARSDIELLVRPVLIEPLRRDWEQTKATIEAQRPAWEQASGNAKQKLQHDLQGQLFTFLDQLGQTTVLDAACGSGNFLYVALHELKDLEKEVLQYAAGVGLPEPARSVGPHQLYGIEINPFAAELARVVVWIGDLQWDRKNGFWQVQEPILRDLETIQCADALMTVQEDGTVVETPWPAATVILGNPPFLGGKRLRTELGDAYVDTLFALYDQQVPRQADFVAYWFERARQQIEDGSVWRAGLLATQAIRSGASRQVLDRIKQTGDIFYAQSDRPWILDGAAVRVSMVGFDNGEEQYRELDGRPASQINANLTYSLDLTKARRLYENTGIAFMGDTKVGPFDINAETASIMIADRNSTAEGNANVVRPWVNGLDITRRPRNMWIIDFPPGMSEQEASQYQLPYAYAVDHVKPFREKAKSGVGLPWWIHQRPRPEMRAKIALLDRYIATVALAKHRLFVWLDRSVLPDHQLIVFTRADDYCFGMLHSRPHECWALNMGSALEDRPRYTPTTTFETFPFPWAPGTEPQDDPQVQAIAAAAHELVRLRDEWLNPPSLLPAQMKERTLTNLYNKKPDWLVAAHEQLDKAVFAAYGWEYPLGDEEILERLLALNLERAAKQGAVAPAAAEEEDSNDE